MSGLNGFPNLTPEQVAAVQRHIQQQALAAAQQQALAQAQQNAAAAAAQPRPPPPAPAPAPTPAPPAPSAANVSVQQGQMLQGMQAMMQQLPTLLEMAKRGMLNAEQMNQLRGLARLHEQQRAMQQNQQRQPSAVPSRTASPAVNAAARPPLAAATSSPTPQSPAVRAAIAASVRAATPVPRTASPALGTMAGIATPPPAVPAATSAPPAPPSTISEERFPIPTTLNATGFKPEPFPNAGGQRPTLTGGLASGPLVGTPAVVQRPGATGWEDALGLKKGAAGQDGDKPQVDEDAGKLLGKRKIQELVASIDPDEKLDPDVEDLLLEIADEFIDSVTGFACQLAKHRKGDTLEVKDLQLHLERNYNIRIPGFGTGDDSRSQARKPAPLQGYASRVAAVHAAVSANHANTK